MFNDKISLRQSKISLIMLFVSLFYISCSESSTLKNYPHPVNNPESNLMLVGEWVPNDVHKINFAQLPLIPSEHVIVHDASITNGVNQHNYLAYYKNKYWLMWSDGPGVEDRVGQRVAFSTSLDGLSWSPPDYITSYPPNSDPSSPHFNTRSPLGYRYISRGFWIRDTELFALVALDEAEKFFGPSLKLLAYKLDSESGAYWEEIGIVFDNTINNFPPKKIPSGEWMMTRRTHDRNVHVLTGGAKDFNIWNSHPIINYTNKNVKAEEPYWWVLPDNNILALFRDNSGSGYLYRSFSNDLGRTWSRLVRTNFPDARSKFNGLQLSDGKYILVSNPNPQKRDPLVLSISSDGIVFDKMGYLFGGRRIDYPHVIEQDGHLFIAFSGNKQSVEVLKIKISELDKLKMSMHE